jgi:hypothetical protein
MRIAMGISMFHPQNKALADANDQISQKPSMSN